jgi:hypothetical protein
MLIACLALGFSIAYANLPIHKVRLLPGRTHVVGRCSAKSSEALMVLLHVRG